MVGEAEGWPTGFARSDANRRCLAVLLGLGGLSPRKLLELAGREGEASACLEAVERGAAGSDADRERAAGEDGGRILAAVAAIGGRLVTSDDPEYPASLEDLADPPAGLFVRGAPLWELTPRIAVVGARRCSALGRDVAIDVGAGIAAAGATVVSGAAAGIDSASHEGALRALGATVAVLGCGIDVAYPPRNARLIARIAQSGAVVSEYPPGVRAMPFRFPARNRIVVGLSEALVVVEGAEGSGSLISVEHALDLGRRVFAVPGPVTSPLSTAPLRLIREGATMIRGPEDLLHDLAFDHVVISRPAPRGLVGVDRAVFDEVVGPTLPATIAAGLRVSVPEVVAALMRLELAGLVRNMGGRYDRRHAPAVAQGTGVAGRDPPVEAPGAHA
jgi:DNA processing protein